MLRLGWIGVGAGEGLQDVHLHCRGSDKAEPGSSKALSVRLKAS